MKKIYLLAALTVLSPASVYAQQYYGGENCSEYRYNMTSDEPVYGIYEYFVTHSKVVPVLQRLDNNQGLTTEQWSQFDAFSLASSGQYSGNSIWSGIGSDLYETANRRRTQNFNAEVNAIVNQAYCPSNCDKDYSAYMTNQSCLWFMEGPSMTGSNFKLGVQCYGFINGEVTCHDKPNNYYAPSRTYETSPSAEHDVEHNPSPSSSPAPSGKTTHRIYDNDPSSTITLDLPLPQGDVNPDHLGGGLFDY